MGYSISFHEEDVPKHRPISKLNPTGSEKRYRKLVWSYPARMDHNAVHAAVIRQLDTEQVIRERIH